MFAPFLIGPVTAISLRINIAYVVEVLVFFRQALADNALLLEGAEALQLLLQLVVLVVVRPTARLDQLRLDAPVAELLGEHRTAYVPRSVKLAGAKVVEDVREEARVAIEEKFAVRPRIEVDLLADPSESRVREIVQSAEVCFVSLAADIEDYFDVGILCQVVVAGVNEQRHVRYIYIYLYIYIYTLLAV